MFLYLKAIHIIVVITWFSGMFYLCRLLIYNAEANDKDQATKNVLQPQLTLMAKRLLYAITLPSAILTTLTGIGLLMLYPSVPTWLLIKMGAVFLLLVYHVSLHLIYLQQKRSYFRYSGYQLRIWNEVPTLFLVSIVMLVVVKENMSPLYGILGLGALVLVLMSAIQLYKYIRKGR